MKIQSLELLSIAFYISVIFLLCSSLSLRKNPTLRTLTLEKHFMKFIFTKKMNYVYIKFFQKIFLYAFNTIKQLFFTIV